MKNNTFKLTYYFGYDEIKWEYEAPMDSEFCDIIFDYMTEGTKMFSRQIKALRDLLYESDYETLRCVVEENDELLDWIVESYQEAAFEDFEENYEED